MKRYVYAAKRANVEDRLRAELLDPENYPELDSQYLLDALAVDWNNVTAEDSELIVVNNTSLDFDNIRSIRYLNKKEAAAARKEGIDDGYAIEFPDGIHYYTWSSRNELFEIDL